MSKENVRYAPSGRVYMDCSRCGSESEAPRCAWPTFPEMTPADPSGIPPSGVGFTCTPCLQLEIFKDTGRRVDIYGRTIRETL